MESSNSEGKEIQIPASIMPLLKPVRHNPFSASTQHNWYMINVIRSGRLRRRFYLNITRHPRQLSNVLTTTVRGPRCRYWHTFFWLTPPRDFVLWRHRYSMTPILSLRGGVGNPADPKGTRTKLKLPQHLKKVKRLEANKKVQDRQTQMHLRRRAPQLPCDQREQTEVTSCQALATPQESVAALVESPAPLGLPMIDSSNDMEGKVENLEKAKDL